MIFVILIIIIISTESFSSTQEESTSSSPQPSPSPSIGQIVNFTAEFLAGGAAFSSVASTDASTAFAAEGLSWRFMDPEGKGLPQTIWFRFARPLRVTAFQFSSHPHFPLYWGVVDFDFFASASDCGVEADRTILSEVRGVAFADDEPFRRRIENRRNFSCYGFRLLACGDRVKAHCVVSRVSFWESAGTEMPTTKSVPIWALTGSGGVVLLGLLLFLALRRRLGVVIAARRSNERRTTAPEIPQIHEGRVIGFGAGKRTPESGDGADVATEAKEDDVYDDDDDHRPEWLDDSQPELSLDGQLEEFDGLTDRPTNATTSVASRIENETKNRWMENLPCDRFRVKLKPIKEFDADDAADAGFILPGALYSTLEDPGADYINAAYVPKFGADDAGFILTQSPTPETVEDFWRMVWFEGAEWIVGIEGERETEGFWPRNVGAEISTCDGRLRVALVTEHRHAHRVFRVMTLNLTRRPAERRLVRHLEFVSWPKEGAPASVVDFVDFCRVVEKSSGARKEKKEGVGNEDGAGIEKKDFEIERKGGVVTERKKNAASPMIVHGVAGSIFVAVLNQTLMAKATGRTNPLQEAATLRRRRTRTIESKAAFDFLRRCLRISCSKGFDPLPFEKSTRRSVAALFDKLGALTPAVDNGVVLTQLDGDIKEVRPAPSNPRGVILETFLPPNGASYDAVFVDSHFGRRGIVVARSPQPATTIAFWSVVWDFDVGIVVAITDSIEGAPRYWPESGGAVADYPPTRVENVGTAKAKAKGIVHDLRLRRGATTKTLKLLEFGGWREGEEKSEREEELVALLLLHLEMQSNSPDRPFLVHCRDGCGSSGFYAVAFNLLQRYTAERLFDWAWSVLAAREAKPGIVESLEQMECLVRVVELFARGREI